MQKITGNTGVAPLECVNPKKDKWKVRWAITEHDDGTADYMEEEFDHRPTLDEIKAVVIGWYNSQIDEQIISGFKWNDCEVWLSSENQFNYKAAKDAAVETNGKTLPVTFKFGTDSAPRYWEFKTVEEISAFYYESMAYINSVLQNGWRVKDSIDFSIYGA